MASSEASKKKKRSAAAAAAGDSDNVVAAAAAAAASASAASGPAPAKKSKKRAAPELVPVPVAEIIKRQPLKAETLGSNTELWLIAVPADVSSKQLDGAQVDLSKASSDISGSHLTMKRAVNLTEPVFAVLPNAEDMALRVAPAIHGELHVEQSLRLLDVQTPAVPPSDIKQPEQLNYRLRLFGSPLVAEKSKKKKASAASSSKS